MNAPGDVFRLARMRRLDLLALWHQLNPDSHARDQNLIGQLSGEALAATILQARQPPA